MLEFLLLVPMTLGLIAFAVRHKELLQYLLVIGGSLHAVATALLWNSGSLSTLGGWIAVDAAGLLFLSVTSGLFLLVAFFTVGHLRGTDMHYPAGHQAVFVGCFLLFLSTMTLTCLSQHLGLLWVAIEATTLASAPLIYFHRSSRSLEATWKYLVICSVGIALALLGNFFLVLSSTGTGSTVSSLVLSDLIRAGPTLLTPWVKVAFVFFLVGFGTKMGLAPMHTWLPDATRKKTN
ncbi:MAG TPA: proton-conducting transporter membrane subunit, partial [Candidatus Ozemobacteraceae bacterium]|nr:proton-conducting transporter membrane subunit [Candidatus Ozemobacteraceae bacterium]